LNINFIIFFFIKKFLNINFILSRNTYTKTSLLFHFITKYSYTKSSPLFLYHEILIQNQVPHSVYHEILIQIKSPIPFYHKILIQYIELNEKLSIKKNFSFKKVFLVGDKVLYLNDFVVCDNRLNTHWMNNISSRNK